MKNFVLVLVFAATVMTAQEDALVFFADKVNVSAALADPITILTQEALDRKQMRGTPIDTRDVPVNETYISQIKSASGITVYAKSKWMNCVYVRGSETNINTLLNESFVTGVEFSDKSLNFFPDGDANDTDKFAIENESSRISYDYGAAENQTIMIAADFLHELDFTGEGVTVAVLDNGFPSVFDNPAFDHLIDEDRILDTYDFVTRQVNVDGTGSHGTRTFSDIGAQLGNQMTGTAPQASFYLFVTEDGLEENPVEEAYWVEALERADSLGVDVVNTSLGYQDYDNSAYDHTYDDLDGQTTIAARGANHAFDKGMFLVTSAGNDGQDFVYVATPADAPGVFTVGAVDADENYASFSSIGPTVDGRIKPDVMAQGVAAAVIDTNGNVAFNNGTSFSSPIMAGAIASLWQSRPQTTNEQLMQIVRESAHLYDSPTDEMGYGIPNMQDAYNALQILGNAEILQATQIAMYPNPASTQIAFSLPNNATTAQVAIYAITGKMVFENTFVAQNEQFDISNLARGVYLVNVTTQHAQNTFKLIKN
jgi:hypothetical protein